jgi:hypothetical protein
MSKTLCIPFLDGRRRSDFARVVILSSPLVTSKHTSMSIVSAAPMQRGHRQRDNALTRAIKSGSSTGAEEKPSILDMALSLTQWDDVSYELARAQGVPVSGDCVHSVEFVGRAYQDSKGAKSNEFPFEISSVCGSPASETVNPPASTSLEARARFANIEYALLSVLNHASARDYMRAVVSFTTSALDFTTPSRIVCGNLVVKRNSRSPHRIAYLSMPRREFLGHVKGRIGGVIVRTFHSGAGAGGIHKRVFAFELLLDSVFRLAAASNIMLNCVDENGRPIASEVDCEYV